MCFSAFKRKRCKSTLHENDSFSNLIHSVCTQTCLQRELSPCSIVYSDGFIKIPDPCSLFLSLEGVQIIFNTLNRQSSGFECNFSYLPLMMRNLYSFLGENSLVFFRKTLINRNIDGRHSK